MAIERALPGRLAQWLSVAEPDWDRVYAEEMPRVYNYFRYRTGLGADAEDLTARTFEKAWRARHRYRCDIAGFSTWLMTIARNVAADHHRAMRPHVPLDDAVAVAAGDGTPEDAAIRRSDARRLAELIEQLPERERDLIAMKFGAGMTNRSIGRTVGLSESNVGTILHRAVQTLRDRW